MSDEFDIHMNKRTDRTYISPAIETKNLLTEEIKKIRIVSKVIDSPEEHSFAKIKNEIVIRVTPQQREELIAKFYEDNRGIFVLTFQKFSKKTGNPHSVYFSFIGDEIKKIIDFVNSIAGLPLESTASSKIDDNKLKDILLSKEQTQKLLRENQDVLIEFVKNDITKSDIVTLGYRKKQLKNFEKLLNDREFFQKLKSLYHVESNERLWQLFFEKNTWIFGYGLNYFFNTPLEEKKLEQVVAGFDFMSSGKRVDALMKTRGLINSLCFAEIKTPEALLIKDLQNPYRRECWQISDDLSGSIAQIQRTIHKSLLNIATKTEIRDDVGNLTGEKVFLYQPKSFIVVGNLNEFISVNGINEEKYSSFELFRQNIKSPEIITFDELYERAKFIIKNTENLDIE
jgi:hypothetical protein